MSTSSYSIKEVRDLEDSIDTFKAKEGDSIDVDFDVRQCTWDDVLSQLEQAQEADGRRGKKWHHKAWRGLGSTAGVVAPVLDVFPDELCVLHGGLALIFSIARHRAQHRMKILSAFEDIPRIIMQARSKAKTFPLDENNPDNVRLHHSIDDLSYTLLKVLPELIKALIPDTIGGRVKATSGLQGDKIDNLLERITRSAQHTRDCAALLLDRTLVETHQTVNDHHEIGKNIYIDTQTTVSSVGDLRNQVDEVLRRQQSLQDTIDAISGKNGLFQFVVELLNNPQFALSPPPEYTPGANAFSVPQARTTAAKSGITPVELLNLLDVQLLGPIEEETQILRRGRSIDDNLLTRAAYMLQTPQVRHLLSAPQPGVVLVDGGGTIDRGAHPGTQNPLSFICATLTQALRRQAPSSSSTSPPPPVIVLVFFCGLHTAVDDPLRGPLGLMRSLLAQLVLELLKNRCVVEEGPMGVLPDENLADNEVYLADLCVLFHNLLRLVPPRSSVYCIVDGISCYEREDWREDYGVVMAGFAKVVRDEGLGAWFKLLLTSMTTCQGLDGWIPYERVSLRSGRSGGGSVARSVRAVFRDVEMEQETARWFASDR